MGTVVATREGRDYLTWLRDQDWHQGKLRPAIDLVLGGTARPTRRRNNLAITAAMAALEVDDDEVH